MPIEGQILDPRKTWPQGAYTTVVDSNLPEGENGIVFPKNDSEGARKVNVQDDTSPPIDLFFTQALGAPTALTNDIAIDDFTFDLDSLTNFTAGTYIGIFSGVSGERRFYFGEILSTGAPNPTSITVDTPIDFAFDAGDPVLPTTRDLNVDGSATFQIFSVQAGGAGGDFMVHITRIMIEITTSSEPIFTDFGDITDGLLRGLVLRRVDGVTLNIWNVKTNSEFANLAYDYTPLIASNPGIGVNGIIVRYTFSGLDKHGVFVELDAGDSLQLIVQDNLSSLSSFRVIAQGRVVTD